MLSCVLFFRFTWVQTSQSNHFTAGLTSRTTVDTDLNAVTSDTVHYCLITLVSLQSHFKNNSTLNKLEAYEKYAIEKQRQKRSIIIQQPNILFSLLIILPVCVCVCVCVSTHELGTEK